jgi:transcriptional regulator with XRE-family HTH domain
MTLLAIGELFRKRRSSLGLRQEDLSEVSGVNMRTIQHLEAGKANPSFATLEKIAFILGLEIVVQVKGAGNG